LFTPRLHPSIPAKPTIVRDYPYTPIKPYTKR
jgi:hypothetical protein